MKKYLVVEGDENGVKLPYRDGLEVELVDWETAEDLLETYFITYAGGVIYEVTDGKLKVVKSKIYLIH